MLFIVMNNHSFSLPEEDYFKTFCSILNPSFRLVKSNTIRADIFKVYNSKKKVLVHYFDNLRSLVSATTDMWTSGNNKAMMAVTVSWLDEEFHMKEVTLGFRELCVDPLNESEIEHSGLNIAKCFYSVLKEYHLEDKVSP